MIIIVKTFLASESAVVFAIDTHYLIRSLGADD